MLSKHLSIELTLFKTTVIIDTLINRFPRNDNIA
jgi:hypothetical protein